MKLNIETLSLAEFYPEFTNLNNVISLMKLSADPFSQENLDNLVTPAINEIFRNEISSKSIIIDEFVKIREIVYNLGVFLEKNWIYYNPKPIQCANLRLFSPINPELRGSEFNKYNYELHKKLTHLTRYFNHQINEQYISQVMTNEAIEYSYYTKRPFFITFFDYSHNYSLDQLLRTIKLYFN